jgi:hypothetical protein
VEDRDRGAGIISHASPATACWYREPMPARSGFAALVLAFALAACGTASSPVATSSDSGTPSGGEVTVTPEASGSATLVTPQPGTSGTSRPSPTPTHHRQGDKTVVTEQDAGSTVELRVGDTLEVRLPSEYTTPAAHPAGPLVRTSSTGGYPSSAPLVAAFGAQAAGRADVDSSTDAACLHATPSCMIPQRLWTVHVVVTR